ncbi:unnamed protein product [Sphagnum jensenii]|uniref:Uncharacterized protein n=1 Tax=Sphagnum jensenii TaxID=128206 RepID=A0ABP0WBP8_9BRYO
MSALVATMEMLFTPLWSFEQFRYLCCNFTAYSHQQPDVVQGHANCLDTETHNDCDLGDDLPQSERLSRGVKNYGCSHYRRRCRIVAPCCNEVFDCRHCHNDIKNVNEALPLKCHEISRHLVKRVICSLCSHEQDVQQVCENCGVCMGEYFCSICKFFDDETKKQQYHCDYCGICRGGGRDNFFHCDRCGCCYSNALQNGHPCVEKSMHQNCPVCFEYLFDSLKEVTVLRCGHTMHQDCAREMHTHAQYCCPICSKSVCDMSSVWEQIDREIASTQMPESHNNKQVWILCNDCGATNEVMYHIVAHKCTSCSSYNTRVTRGAPNSTSSTSSSS